MGLSVKVYKNISQVSGFNDNYDFRAYVISKEWDFKIKNLVNGGFYNGVLVDNSIDYPYSSHGSFRRFLIELIGKDDDLLLEDGGIDWVKHNLMTTTPFHDFINFADNEGCLDWEVSARIYEDFKKFENKLKGFDFKSGVERDYCKNLYSKWMNVFFLAKDRGVVVFS
jgi:hypothetical protein